MVFLSTLQVPTKKLKKYEKEYQTMRESQLQQEDPMDRYKVWETQGTCLSQYPLSPRAATGGHSFPLFLLD